jgi:hypothetical protein
MDELATWLGHERRLLELLLFKLVEGRHLLAAGEARFLALAAAEVERAMRRVQEAELARSILVSRLAGELGIPEDDLTLSALSRDSLEPYRSLFDDHRRAFLGLVTEIEEVTRQNRRLAAQGAHDVDKLLALVGDPAEEAGVRLYGPGSRSPVPTASRFDTVL